ncbi:hypothetical protein GCM10009123_18260 [Kangiella japonica]|uniref:M23ase beta-sheet core domain-containing protein n=1 Tax=Kangiella japonica TaxID=647384 RepID=A0ABP3CNN2_9GAMM
MNKLQFYKSLGVVGLFVATSMNLTVHAAEDNSSSQASVAKTQISQQVDNALTKQQVVYDYDEMLSFDVQEYLAENAPHLADKAEIISHYAGYSSISPKLLIALMEQESGLISSSKASSNTARPFGILSSKAGFREQVEDISSRLAMEFYKGHSYAQTGVNEKQTTDLDAVKAIKAILAPKYSSNADSAMKFSQTAHAKAVISVGQTYNKLFGDADSKVKSNSETQQKISNIDDYFQLPYLVGETWRNGGTHTNNGSGSYPQSSLDFNDGGRWGDNLRHIWVTAAAPGTVKYHSSCFMEVIHESGWSTTYYHLENIQYGTNATVDRNTRIANYADTRGQALCNGGQSTGPHLHFSLKKNGQYYHLDGVKLSGYKVDAGRNSYDSDCNYFWLERNGQRYCAWTNVYNYGVSDEPPGGGDTYTGYLDHGAQAFEPDGSYFYYNGGTIDLSLTGPSNVDFDLALWKWINGRWYSVAASTTPYSSESINYQAGAAYYTVRVNSYSGSGNYSLTIDK